MGANRGAAILPSGRLPKRYSVRLSAFPTRITISSIRSCTPRSEARFSRRDLRLKFFPFVIPRRSFQNHVRGDTYTHTGFPISSFFSSSSSYYSSFLFQRVLLRCTRSDGIDAYESLLWASSEASWWIGVGAGAGAGTKARGGPWLHTCALLGIGCMSSLFQGLFTGVAGELGLGLGRSEHYFPSS